ncbi:hypothetical protein DXB03_18055 [Lachnospiraceae bacterium OF11-28]|nr:hypothetical protein DXB03_18055 [Lachnospiraceae bacterium OF11-28]
MSGYLYLDSSGSFLVQLYTDFSGCMDIVLGASECYGIILPENFRTPFFAKTVQEFWQRWHITLGGWLRDYIMYPVLRSNAMRKLNRKLKSKYGKKNCIRDINLHCNVYCMANVWTVAWRSMEVYSGRRNDVLFMHSIR